MLNFSCQCPQFPHSRLLLLKSKFLLPNIQQVQSFPTQVNTTETLRIPESKCCEVDKSERHIPCRRYRALKCTLMLAWRPDISLQNALFSTQRPAKSNLETEISQVKLVKYKVNYVFKHGKKVIQVYLKVSNYLLANCKRYSLKCKEKQVTRL